MPRKTEISEQDRLIGERLTRAVKERGLSAIEIGERLGLTRDAVHTMMRGSSVANWSKLARFAELLHTTPNDILGMGPTGGNRRFLVDILAQAFQGLGLKPALARELVQICLEALDTQPGSQPDALALLDELRVQAKTLKRISDAE